MYRGKHIQIGRGLGCGIQKGKWGLWEIMYGLCQKEIYYENKHVSCLESFLSFSSFVFFIQIKFHQKSYVISNGWYPMKLLNPKIYWKKISIQTADVKC